MKNLVYTIAFILFTSFGFGQGNELFNKANDAYADGNYKEATRLYEKVLNEGYVSPELYYNLANAYYKQEKIAPSIYYYEKALQLSPGEDYILNNLRFAQNMTVDEIDVVPLSKIEETKRAFIFYLNYNQWAYVAIGWSFLCLLAFIVYLFGTKPFLKRSFFSLSILAFLFSIASFFMAHTQENLLSKDNFGIIFSEEIDVFSEPNSSSRVLFSLHEGTKVNVVDEFRDYQKIELANGSTGWVNAGRIKLLEGM